MIALLALLPVLGAVSTSVEGREHTAAPPVVEITSGPSGTVPSSDAHFEFASTPARVLFQCTLDGAALAGCRSPQDYSGLTEGTHVFLVRPLGAFGAAFALRTWTVDTTPGSAPNVFVLPHVIESAGTITNTQFTFDTSLIMTYAGGQAGAPSGPGATVDFYLYDQATGLPMKSATAQDVCNPCSFALGSGGAPRKRAVQLDSVIVAAGGFPSPTVLGFGIAVVTGDPANVTLTSLVLNSKTSAFDLDIASFAPQALRSALTPVPGGNRFVVPHVLEMAGKITNTTFTFDTSFFMTYVAGLAGAPGGTGATVDLYLFSQSTGQPLQSATLQDVCNPCSYVLGPSGAARKRVVTVDDEIVARGGFASGVALAYAILVVGGDAANVNITSAIINAKTSAFDLDVVPYEPQPLLSEP
jgi:hypothetical protein